MTQLLVSVRDAREAAEAVASGAALIDVKEPRNGSLGATDPAHIAAVVDAVGGRVPVSAALGELLDEPAYCFSALPGALKFAKLGLAGCARMPDWPQRWSAATGALPPQVRAVAVVYADWRSVQAPSPPEVVEQAVRQGAAAVLVDTFDKSRGGLLDHWPEAELREFVAAVRDRRLLLVLAGSLTFETVAKVLPLAPDYIAVRGAVCRESRTATLDGARVERLVRLIAAAEQPV